MLCIYNQSIYLDICCHWMDLKSFWITTSKLWDILVKGQKDEQGSMRIHRHETFCLHHQNTLRNSNPIVGENVFCWDGGGQSWELINSILLLKSDRVDMVKCIWQGNTYVLLYSLPACFLFLMCCALVDWNDCMIVVWWVRVWLWLGYRWDMCLEENEEEDVV